MTNNELDNIEAVEPKSSFDATKYEGRRVKIEKVEKIEKQSHWINGSYDANKTVTIPAIEISTEPLDELPQADGTTKPLIVTRRLNLQEQVQPDGTKKLVISKNPKAALWAFMRKLGVTKINDMVGKIVTIITEVDDDGTSWLRIA